MKGARRTRKSRHQAGFADLMAPPHPTTSMRGVVTGVSRTQSTLSASNPTTPNPPTPPNPTTPPPVDEDWGALLHTTPKRRMSPQKPIIATSPNSSSPTQPSPTRTTPQPKKISLQLTTAPSPSASTPVPAFLSGWDGADGWGDDPSLDDSDQDLQDDAWGAWPESDDILSSHPQVTSDTPTASEHHVETELDFGMPSSAQPSSKQQPDPLVDPKTHDATDVAGEHPITDPETCPPDRAEENDLLPDNELFRQPADTELLKVKPDGHPGVPMGHGAFENLEAALEPPQQSVANEILSEHNLVQTPVISAPEHPTGDFRGEEGDSGGDEQDSRVEIDFSGWDDAKVAREEPAEFPVSYTEATQSVKQTFTKETKPHIEGQEDQKVPHDEGHADTFTPPQSTSDTVAVDGSKETDSEIHQDPDMSTISAVVPVVLEDKRHDATSAQLPMNAWGFEESCKDGPVSEVGWGWGETEDASTSNVDGNEYSETSSGVKETAFPNDVTSVSLKGNSQEPNSTSSERTSEQDIENTPQPALREKQESKDANKDVDPFFVSAELSTAAPNGWDFDENAKEANTDDWGWGAPMEENEVEFAVDSSLSNANAHLSVPEHDSSVQAPASESLHSIRQTGQMQRTMDGFREQGDKSVGDGPVDGAIDQKLQGVKDAGDATSFNASRTSEDGNDSAMGYDQAGGTAHEVYRSFPVAGESALNQRSHGDETLDQTVLVQTHSEQRSEESPANNGPAKAIEEDLWGADVRSTDVDVSSTNAGTDVPSVAAPSSVDDADWEADRTEIRVKAANALNREMLKSVASGVTSSFAWGDHDGTSHTDRSWADPNAIWSSPPSDAHLSLAAQEGITSADIVGKDEPVDAESADSNLLLPTASDPANATMTGIVEEASLLRVRDNSLPDSTPSYPRISLEKFEHYREDHTGPAPISKAESYDRTKVQTAEVPDILGDAESRKAPEEPQVDQSELQIDIQSFPQPKQLAAPDDAISSLLPTNRSSNQYWTERLDESRSKKPDIPDDRSQTASSEFLTAMPDESQMETQFNSHDRLKVEVDNVRERDCVSVRREANLSTTPRQPMESSSAVTVSDVVSSPSGNVESRLFPEPAVPVGSEREPALGANQNGMMLAPSPAMDPEAQSRGLDRRNEAVETKLENGPTSREDPELLNAAQSLQPGEGFSLDGGDGSSKVEFEEGYNGKNDYTAQSDPTEGQKHDMEESKMVLARDDDNSTSAWEQYAPRFTSTPPSSSFSVPVPGKSPPPPAELSAENQQSASKMETLSYDTAAYDPFSMSHEDADTDYARSTSEAFEWNIEVHEPVGHPQTSTPVVPAVPQEASGLSPRAAQSRIRSQTIIGQDHTQGVTSLEGVSQPPTDLKEQPDSHIGHQAETASSHDRSFGDGGVKLSEDERRTMSPNIQGRIIENGAEECKMREHQSTEIPQDDLTLTALEPQPSFNDDVGLGRYAPRSAQPVETGSSAYKEDPSSSVRQEEFDDSIAKEDGGSYPHIPVSSGIPSTDATFPLGQPLSYQSVHPGSALPFEGDVSTTIPELPAQVSAPNTHGDMQSRQLENGGFPPSPIHEAVGTPELMHSGLLPIPRPPLPAAPDASRSQTGETQDSSIPGTSKSEGRDLNENLSRYQEDYAGDRTYSLPYAPAQRESQQISPELCTEAAEIKQRSLSMHSAREQPLDFSEPRWVDSSSPYSPQAAYANAVGPSQSQGGHGVTGPKDAFFEGHGPYGIVGECNSTFTVPPPSQQAPLPPPSIPTNQEAFPTEPILDPSTFSYPYSILDTETSEDPSYRPQRPLVSWGFGGKLVTVIPPHSNMADSRLPAEVKGSSTVHIHNLTDIAQDGSNDDWAAASEAVSPLSLPVRPPDMFVYADMCDRLSKFSAGLSGSEAEGRAAMWRILALLCRQGTSDWRINASTAISGPSSVPLFGRNNNSSLISGKVKWESPLRESELVSGLSAGEKRDAAAEVERLLTLGSGAEAIRVAQESGLWSIALVLAATIDKSLYMKTVSEFAKSTLQDGSALQMLCLSTAEDEAEILRKATSSSGLKEWRKTVGMLLTTRSTSPNADSGQQSRFLQLIDQIGEALITQRNDVLAGHICFLLSGRLGPLDSSNIPLLGADPNQPSGRPRSMGSPAVALQSLVLEAVANAQSGAMYPHILPFRLLLAEEVCSVGRPDVALAHCESISCAVREVFQSGRKDLPAKFFTLPFLSHLESLEQRLRIHLGFQESGGKKGGLSALGKSLSSVFARSSTADSKDVQPVSRENPTQSAPLAGSRESSQLHSIPDPSPSSLSPTVSSDIHPHMITESQWTPKFELTHLQSLPVGKTSQGVQQDKQSGDVSGNERWNSLVSKTIGFIAPAEGDLSPPLKARGGQGVPFHAQPSPLGLGKGPGSRALSHDVHAGHMRSASVGDVPIMQSRDPMAQGHGRGAYSHGTLQVPPESQTGSPNDLDGKPADVSNFSGMSVKKATTAESGTGATHRRSASDMTFETQTSEKKPPRPPKKPSALPPGVELQPMKENAPAIKGWRSRLSEKIRAAFGGPPRAHMGVENKFRYDKEKGRWIIDGEDPNEEDNIPPPPPDDDVMGGVEQKVPFSQSYESLPNPDLGNQFLPHTKAANSHGIDDFRGEAVGADNFRRYSYNAQLGYNSSAENANSKDTGSESSVASAASAPVPFSSQPGIPMSASAGNKFRAQPGRLSGRRAYVDTLNKEAPAPSMSALPRTARPGVPSMPGLSSSNPSGYRIFTPSPAVVPSGGLDNTASIGQGGGAPPGTSSIAESSDQGAEMHQEIHASNGQQPGDPFGYGVPKPAPMPSVEQYQRSIRNERQPRLMA